MPADAAFKSRVMEEIGFKIMRIGSTTFRKLWRKAELPSLPEGRKKCELRKMFPDAFPTSK
jgi:hypothetical protein